MDNHKIVNRVEVRGAHLDLYELHGLRFWSVLSLKNRLCRRKSFFFSNDRLYKDRSTRLGLETRVGVLRYSIVSGRLLRNKGASVVALLSKKTFLVSEMHCAVLELGVAVLGDRIEDCEALFSSQIFKVPLYVQLFRI